MVITDPPFFDNVHYSELADFFYAWQQIRNCRCVAPPKSTRSPSEVQDADPDNFASKLRSVFEECHRVLKDDGLLVFTYHHSRSEGWHSLAGAVMDAGFTVVNSQPVKSEMSVATPKSQAKEPIQLDMVLVCRKTCQSASSGRVPPERAIETGRTKLGRLIEAGFNLSNNDRRIVLFGQLLTSISNPSELARASVLVQHCLDQQLTQEPVRRKTNVQSLLFEECENERR